MASQNRPIRIGTRASKLAMWQAEYVKSVMDEQEPDIDFSIVSMTTTGDNILNVPLSQFENKGIFTKELDIALLTNQVDVVVHCMKDLATELPPGIKFCAVMEREDADDVVILHPKHKENYEKFLQEWNSTNTTSQLCPALAFLQPESVIGTSALRRQAMLARYHPNLVCKDVRGNLLTRFEKLDRGDYDALILARIGVERLGLGERISAALQSEHYLHAVGQAALAIVYREGDEEVKDLFMQYLHNIPSAISCTIERGMLAKLQGGCKVPIAVSSKFYVVPNAVATKHVALVEGYNTIAKTLQGAELQKLIELEAASPQSSRVDSASGGIGALPPIETDPIPSHLYTGITSLVKPEIDLRNIIIEQNNLVHSLDSDYEDGDDDEDDFRRSNSFTHKPSPFQQQVSTRLASLGEDDGPAVNITGSSKQQQEPMLPITPVKMASQSPLSVSTDLDFYFETPTVRERKFSAPLTPRTQAHTWALLVVTRAAVVSMNGQNYVETIKAEQFPLYLKSQFTNPISTKAWAIGRDLGNDLIALGANRILEQIRAEGNITTE